MIINSTPVRTMNSTGINNCRIDNFKIDNHCTVYTNLCTVSPSPIPTCPMGKDVINLLNKGATNYYQINKSGEYYLNTSSGVCTNSISVPSGTTATISIEYSVQSDYAIYTYIHCMDNSTVNIINICHGTNAKRINCMLTNVDSNCTVNTYNVYHSTGTSSINYTSNINGDNSTSNVYTIYTSANGDYIDLNYIINVLGKNNATDMQVVGTLDGAATKHAKCTINFVKGCTGSTGTETEDTLVLSPSAHSVSLPMVLSGEEDASGSHAVSVGKIDESTLYYIMSRGLTQAQATALMIEAKYNKIITKLPSKDIQNNILNILKEQSC